MQLRLESKADVRRFAFVTSAVALVGSVTLMFLFFPSEVYQRVVFEGVLITLMLSLPITYFVGLRILDVHELTTQLEHAVNYDELTGMCTRISFYQRVAGIEDLPLAMIVVDVDHFKVINDTYGHQAGDSALKQFAATLLRNCREDDVVARFGGEEFVILLRQATLEDAMLAAQRLCDKVREKTFAVQSEALKITASFGVTAVESVGEIDDAINRADQAAYRAKREGRDRVCAFDADLDMWDPRHEAAQ